MKIVRLSTFLDFGGLETRLVNISYVNDSNEWVFVCLNKSGDASKKIIENHKKVVNLNSKVSIYSLFTTWKVYKFLKKEKPAVLHTSSAEANFHGVVAGKLAGVKKIVAEEVGIPSHSFLAKIVFNLIYKLANQVIGNSTPVIEALHKIDHVPYNKIHKVNNPVIFKELSHTSFSFQPTTATHIISVSRLTKVKNLNSAIHVIGKLIHENYNLYYHIYGEGEEKPKLEKLIKDLKLDQRVILYGYEANPLEKLSAADIFILNSYTEGFSNSLAEAMYAKKIVISTKSGSAEEMIKHGKSGFLINVDDENNLFLQLKTVLALSKDEKNQIQEAAHDKIKNSYSLENHLKDLYTIYNL